MSCAWHFYFVFVNKIKVPYLLLVGRQSRLSKNSILATFSKTLDFGCALRTQNQGF